MKILRLFSVAFLALLGTAHGDLTIVQKVEGITHGSPGHEMTIKIKGDKARFDVSPQISTIIDSKTGEMINLLNDQKKFIRISTEQMKALGEMAAKLNGNKSSTDKPKLTPTGKKEIINNYEAEEYAYESPLWKGTYWISTSFPDAMTILKQLQAVNPEAWSTAAKGLPNYKDFPGLPLKSRVIIGDQQITSTVTSVKQDSLSDADFSVPKDFQELKVPNMFGGKPPSKPEKSDDE
jgi:hypothetical protein